MSALLVPACSISTTAHAIDLPTARLFGRDIASADILWLAVTAGFAATAWFALRAAARMRDDSTIAGLQAKIAELRAALDRSEAMLGSDDQRTVIWDSPSDTPRVIGALSERVGAPQNPDEFLAVGSWLEADSVTRLETAIQKLRGYGEGFNITLTTLSNDILEATGRTSGRRTITRFRELTGERRSFAELKEQATVVVSEMTALRAMAEHLPFPVWRRNEIGRIIWVNNAYAASIEAQDPEAAVSSGAELLGPKTRDSIREIHKKGRNFDEDVSTTIAGEQRNLHVLDIIISDGSIGVAIDESRADAVRQEKLQAAETHARTLDQLTAGIAVFDSARKLRFHNAAFRTLWDLTPEFLDAGPDEAAVLDQLRADRKLPEQANYREWRENHLEAYGSDGTREDWWHLPDGRSVRVVAMSRGGEMIYIYENVTEQLSLESRVNVLSQLQGETLDHLAEGVAVFGSDGKMRLFNPVFADIWRLSPNMLREEPHIAEIIENCSRSSIQRDEVWEGIRIAITELENTWPVSGRMERPGRQRRRLRHRIAGPRHDDADIRRRDRFRPRPEDAQRTERGSGSRRPFEVGLYPARVLRTAVATDVDHRVCRDDGRRARSAELNRAAGRVHGAHHDVVQFAPGHRQRHSGSGHGRCRYHGAEHRRGGYPPGRRSVG